MIRILILLVTTFILRTWTMGCTWIPTSFCTTTNDRPDDAVISGRIIGVDMDGIDLLVIDVLRGDEARDTIRIWDGTDFDCNGIFSMAASGLGGVEDSIIVVMPLITEIENTWDVLGDYRRPNYFALTTEMRIINGMVLGLIAGSGMNALYTMPYPDFVAVWSVGTIGCSNFLSIQERAVDLPRFQNPVQDILELTFTGSMEHGRTVRIRASSGQEVLTLEAASTSLRIDLSSFAPGVYHLVVTGEDRSMAATRVMKL